MPPFHRRWARLQRSLAGRCCARWMRRRCSSRCRSCGRSWATARCCARCTSSRTISGLSARPTHWPSGDMDTFLSLVRESGRSSWELLQDITPTGAVREQAMAVAFDHRGARAERSRRLPCTWRRLCWNHPGVCSAGPLCGLPPGGREHVGSGLLPHAEHPSGGRRGSLAVKRVTSSKGVRSFYGNLGIGRSRLHRLPYSVRTH